MDSLYLKCSVGIPLSSCIAELSAKRPADPIEWMSHWLYRYVDGEIYFYEKKLMLNGMQKMQLEIRRTHERTHTCLNRLHHQIKESSHEIHHNAVKLRELLNKVLKQKTQREKLKREEENERKAEHLSAIRYSRRKAKKIPDDPIYRDIDHTVMSDAALFAAKFDQQEDHSPSNSTSDDEINIEPRFSLLREVDGYVVRSQDNTSEILEMQKRFRKMMHPDEPFKLVSKFRKFSNFMSPWQKHKPGSKVDPNLSLQLRHRQSLHSTESPRSDARKQSTDREGQHQLQAEGSRDWGSMERLQRRSSRTMDWGRPKDGTEISQLDMTEKARPRRRHRRRRSRQESEEKDDGDEQAERTEGTERRDRRERREKRERGRSRPEEQEDGGERKDEQAERTEGTERLDRRERREKRERGRSRPEEQEDGGERKERTDRRERRDRQERRERAEKPERSRSRVSGEREEWEEPQFSDDGQDDDRHKPITSERKPKRNVHASLGSSFRPTGTKPKRFRQPAKTVISEEDGEQARSLREEEYSEPASSSYSSRSDPELVSAEKKRLTDELKYRATWRVDCNLGLVCDHAILGLMQGRPPFIPPETPEAWASRNYIPESHYDHEIYSCSNTDVLETFDAMEPHVTYQEFIRKGSWLQAEYLVAMNPDVKSSYMKDPIISVDERQPKTEKKQVKHKGKK